ncbi:hypothetical protein [Thiothrix sp.]|jgi:hypothetical protein|uniref:hypothetical protein n=1 Tax=Thiothrix sp. TaxID=1032 RepID=UPI00257CAEFC|nr:hypothetical protein [Thiothrix sp.]
MYKRLALLLFLTFISNNIYAVDLTSLICGQPDMSKQELTRMCGRNALVAGILCRGNEGAAWCESAQLEIGDVSHLTIKLKFRNKHQLMPGIIMYNSTSSGIITASIDKDCKVIKKNVEFSDPLAKVTQFLLEIFNSRIENSLPNKIPECQN